MSTTVSAPFTALARELVWLLTAVRAATMVALVLKASDVAPSKVLYEAGVRPAFQIAKSYAEQQVIN